MIITYIGSIGVCLSLCVNVPQIIKMALYKSSRDVSLWTYIILFLACLCNFIYVISIGDIILICRSLIGVTSSMIAIIVWLKYRPKKPTGILKN